MNRTPVSFYLPGFFDRMHMQLAWIMLMEKYPEFFCDNVRIGALYDAFPGSLWNGGRCVLGQCDRQEAEYVISEFDERGIPLRFTFTNSLLEEEHLGDPFCNFCLEQIASPKRKTVHEVLVNSPLLEAYIRTYYPAIPLISSTTKQIRSITKLEGELEKDYRLVVGYKALNTGDQLLQIAPEKRGKLEVLADSFCMDDCPRSKQHYEEVARAQLEGREPGPLAGGACRAINRDFYEFMENETFITRERLYGQLVPAGFLHIKLDGRTFTDADVIESYLYYMTKPEQTEARDRLRLVMHKSLEKLRRM
ncbi:MAG: hypothetical protein K6E18_08810 [Lachnospiraceae bacterium]|nr:hypothetical protein [Lachnospiraceae bacterium]